jgi:cellulose synthase/poly-beta-1,6-N-acetylglucosamine synthase-like glycosyltransferase
MVADSHVILEFFKVVWSLLNILLLILEGYLFLISVFAWRKKSEHEAKNPFLHSFALIIAAHNEETVIKNLIDNLAELHYPKDKYDIFVIADHCQDRTAEVAKSSGAFVYERSNCLERGKGNALKWLFPILFKLERQYDAICIFDADNLVYLTS